MTYLSRPRKSFTLLELMVAFIIMAVLSAVAIPSLIGVVGNDQLQADSTSASSIVDAAFYNAESQVGEASPTVTFPITAAEANGFVPAGTSSEIVSIVDASYGDPVPAIEFTFTDGDVIYTSAPQSDTDPSPTVLGGTSTSGGTIGGGAGTTTTTAPTTTTTNPNPAPPVLATIAVSDPYSVAINPAGTFAYVTQLADNSVSVVDLSTNDVTATIHVPGAPEQVAFSPSGDTAYVLGLGDVIEVIDTGTNTVTREIDITGAYPTNIAISSDGSTLYVVNQNDQSVSVVDAASGVTTATITGLPMSYSDDSIAVNAAGTYAYVSSLTGVVVLDLTTDTVSTVVTTLSPANGLVLSPDGSTLYATGGNLFYAIDTATNTVTSSGYYGSEPFSVAIDASGDTAAVVATDTFTELDTASSTIIAQVAISDSNHNDTPISAVNASATKFYVVNEIAGTLTVYGTP